MVKVVCLLMQQIDIYFSTVIDIFKWLEISIISKSSVAIQVRRLNAAVAICHYFHVRRCWLIIVNSSNSIYFLNKKIICDQVQKLVSTNWATRTDGSWLWQGFINGFFSYFCTRETRLFLSSKNKKIKTLMNPWLWAIKTEISGKWTRKWVNG